MSTNLLVRLDLSKDRFSKNQIKVARYIENEYDKAAYLTAFGIAEKVGVSESTVVRFAQLLGYSGYPELQKAMQAMIRDNLSSVGRVEVTTGRIGSRDVIESVLNQDIDKIKRTIEDVSRKDFDDAVQSVIDAKHIYVFGVKSSSYIAAFLSYYLDLIFGNVKLLNTTSKTSNYENLFRISENDVMIAISFPRYSTIAVDSMKYAREQGAKVIAITDTMSSPLVKNADSVLLAHSDIASFVDTLVAPLSLIDALLVAIVKNCKDDVVKTLTKLEDVWNEQYIKTESDEV